MPIGEIIDSIEPESYSEGPQLSTKRRGESITLPHTSETPKIPLRRASISAKIVTESKILLTQPIKLSKKLKAPENLKQKSPTDAVECL